MNNNRTENFQRMFFKHIESLLKSNYFILEKKNEKYYLEVNESLKELLSDKLEDLFRQSVKYCNQKNLSLDQGNQYIRQILTDSILGEKTFQLNNEKIKNSINLFEEYKNRFLGDEKVILQLEKPNKNSKVEDLYSYENKYRNTDIRTQIIVFNLVLPLINYFEKNNYEIKEMFEDIASVGGVNLFPAVETISISDYSRIKENLEMNLEKYDINKMTLLDDDIIKINVINQQYKLGKSVRGKYIVKSDDDWNKMSRELRILLSDFEILIANKSEDFLIEKMAEYGDKWNDLEKVYDLARNKAHIFNILQKAFTLPFRELSDYRDSLLSDKKSMLSFDNSSDFKMTQDYQVNFSKIVQRHLEEMEIKEVAKKIKKNSLGI